MSTRGFVREIQNDMIFLLNSGLERVFDSVTQNLLISDTTLKSFIPPQVRKMTPKLRQIFGCDICIIPKDIQIGLNRFRTINVIYLQHNSIGINPCKHLFSTKSSAH